MKKILIVDDDAELRGNLAEILKQEGYETDQAGSAREAIEKTGNDGFDVVLLDFMMPKMSGIDALIELRRLRPKAKVIMVTAFATIENAIDAIKKGASDYIAKPFKITELLTTVRRAIEEARFEEGMQKVDVDHTLSSLANPIRRNILKLLGARQTMRLMELTRELGIEDHTKVVFHLKILKEAGIIEQNAERSYALTKEGARTIEILGTVERYLSP